MVCCQEKTVHKGRETTQGYIPLTGKSTADQKVGLHPHQTLQWNMIHWITAASLVYTPEREKNGHFLARYLQYSWHYKAKLTGKSNNFVERTYLLLEILEYPNTPSGPSRLKNSVPLSPHRQQSLKTLKTLNQSLIRNKYQITATTNITSSSC